WGQSSSLSSCSSTIARSSSGLWSIGLRCPFRARQLLLDRLRKLGELTEDLERPLGRRALVRDELVELRARGFDARQQLLRPGERFVRAHQAAFSRTILPRMPFTSLPASSDA